MKSLKKAVPMENPEEGISSFQESNPSLSDGQVWEKFRDGDEGAFVIIYQKYVNTLFSYGLQFCKDEELIKDTIQDFFIYLREKRGNLSNTHVIKFYLLKAFRRRLFDQLNSLNQKKSNREKYSKEETFKFEFSEETKLIDREFSQSQLLSLNQAIKRLSSKEREVIYLFYFENLSYQQISEIHGFRQVSSARRLVYKALDQLRLILKFVVLFFSFEFIS